MSMNVTVIGAGLAGSECAWQLAQRGIQVELHEMKPEKMTPAHTTEYFAELCCSNSLRGAGLENAVGLLKEELRRLDSLILQCADATRVEALLDPGKLLVHNVIRRDDLFRQHYITFHIGVHTFRHHLYDRLRHFLQKGVIFRLPPV